MGVLSIPYFVDSTSIVRRIWGQSDVVLLIFAGASAEFALNKAVDWLYYTGKLPADPLGRLFSTVQYAKAIVFAPEAQALRAIGQIRAIHSAVEDRRGYQIPAWAYRDVLYMLIYYSISSFELLERKLSRPEKEEVFQVFRRVGMAMGLEDLPLDYPVWEVDRARHVNDDLEMSKYTGDLFHQYRKHLGPWRFQLLKEVQKLLLPAAVRHILYPGQISWLKPGIPLYRLGRRSTLNALLHSILVPHAYRDEVRELDLVQP